MCVSQKWDTQTPFPFHLHLSCQRFAPVARMSARGLGISLSLRGAEATKQSSLPTSSGPRALSRGWIATARSAGRQNGPRDDRQTDPLPAREENPVLKAALERSPETADPGSRCRQIRVPSVSTRRRNSASTRPVIGPGLPVPISRPSSFTTGMTSAPVPVRKHSSAFQMS